MIIKNITGKQISTTGAILPFKKNINGNRILDYDIKDNDHEKVIEANLMPGLRKGYFYRSCLLNLNMSYEQMILTVADNGTIKNV